MNTNRLLKLFIYPILLLFSLFKIDVKKSKILIHNRDAYTIIVNINFIRCINICITEFQKIIKSTHVYGSPYLAIIEPCNICNLKCPLCLSGGAYRKEFRRGKMSLDTFNKILNENGRYLTSITLYNWGEPLLNKDLFKMIKIAKEMKVGVQISTNLQIFNAEMADDLISSGLERLIISLDGATQETYGMYRVGGSFEKVIENTKLLIKKKGEHKSFYPIIDFQTVVMRHNEHELSKIESLAKEMGVDNCTFVPVSLMTGINADNLKYLPISRENEYYDHDSSSNEISRKKLRDCHWLYRYIVVNWDGGIFGCCSTAGFDKDCFGNIRDEKFKNQWNNKFFKAGRLAFRHKNSDVYTKCSICAGLYSGE